MIIIKKHLILSFKQLYVQNGIALYYRDIALDYCWPHCGKEDHIIFYIILNVWISKLGNQ